MNHPEKTVHLLPPSDVIRIRELLFLFQATLDRIFERTETSLNADPDELMNDVDFCEKSTFTLEVDGDI